MQKIDKLNFSSGLGVRGYMQFTVKLSEILIWDSDKNPSDI